MSLSNQLSVEGNQVAQGRHHHQYRAFSFSRQP